jgi:hypothetical protein
VTSWDGGLRHCEGMLIVLELLFDSSKDVQSTVQETNESQEGSHILQSEVKG